MHCRPLPLIENFVNRVPFFKYPVLTGGQATPEAIDPHTQDQLWPPIKIYKNMEAYMRIDIVTPLDEAVAVDLDSTQSESDAIRNYYWTGSNDQSSDTIEKSDKVVTTM